MTNGCTGGAEEGHSHNHPSGANPSLGLPAHAARATSRRRRKASSRWMVGLISGSPSPLQGESERGVTSPEHVARGPSASSLARGESPRHTKREEGCGPRRAARIEARECARTSFFYRLQKSIGDHCWSHTSSFTGQKGPGRSQGRRGVNGDLIQGVEPSSPARNCGRRRS
jgi:hypothetical protein